MERKRSGVTTLLVLLASLLMIGIVGLSHAEDCPDQGGLGRDAGIINPPDTDDKKHGCDDEDTKERENNGPGNDADCEDDSNGRGRIERCAVAVALTISKSARILNDGGRIGFPDPGEEIEYTVTFANASGTATNVVVRDVINENLSGTGGCVAGQDQTTNFVVGSANSTVGTVTFSGGAVQVTSSSLNAGQTGTLTFRVSIPSGTFHDCNRATIDGSDADAATSNTVCF